MKSMNTRISYLPTVSNYGAYQEPQDSAQERFERALSHVLRFEGGLSNHPLDRGNRGGHWTAYGVTQAAYNTYRTRHGLPQRSTRNMTKHEVHTLYYEDYWLASSADKLPAQVRLVHFDAAVNHGVHRANRLLQRALGVREDGILGPQTLQAIKSRSDQSIARNYLSIRKNFYNQIVDRTPAQKVFLKGWLARIEKLQLTLDASP